MCDHDWCEVTTMSDPGEVYICTLCGEYRYVERDAPNLDD